MRVRSAVAMVAGALLVATAAGAGEFFPQAVASGDPSPDSVVLWTRVVDAAAAPDADLSVSLEVATDAGMTQAVVERDLAAKAQYDHCVKVRVDGLAADTTYYYRFSYQDGSAVHVSPVGRTKTAPAPESTRPICFAVTYGQDYIGRYYNAYLDLLRQHPDDLDFVLFIGDYVYETTGDPSFQSSSAGRKLVFQDEAGAIQLGSPEAPYFAASSLANYRTLYKTYLSDPVLLQVREQYPEVVIWDDHEFSDDCWGAHANYFNGRTDEYEPDRRRRAEQAWMEYVPSEVGLGPDGTLDINTDNLYPRSGDYRSYRWGQNLHLVLTDYRTFRPDHLVPEDAFPGAIPVDEPTVRGMLGDAGFQAVEPSLDPYVNIDLLAAGGLNIFRQTATLILSQAYLMEEPSLDQVSAVKKAQAVMHGNVSATYLGLLFSAAGLPSPFDDQVLAAMPRGLSYLFIGKQNLFSSTGSRYLLMLDAFKLYAGARFLATNGASEDAFGPQQTAWLQGELMQPPATWNVLVSSVSMAPMVLDFTNPVLAGFLPPDFPDLLRQRLLINADQWDGFPNMRTGVLGMLRQLPNPIVLGGDIHGSFVVNHQGVYEFTGPAISSESLQDMVLNKARALPQLAGLPGLDQLVANLDAFLQISAQDHVNVTPDDIVATDTASHGYLFIKAGPDAWTASLRLAPDASVETSFYDHPEDLDDLFTTRTFEVQGGVLTPITPQ